METLTIALLGTMQVTRRGETLPGLEANATRALLIHLVMHADRPLPRELLAGHLWPESPNSDALANLRVTLYRLRNAIGDRDADPPHLLVSRSAVQLNAASDVWSDVAAFDAHVRAAGQHFHPEPELCSTCVEHLSAAAELYQGDFVRGFSYPSAELEGWVVTQREALHLEALEVLDRLARHHAQRGTYSESLANARRQIDLEPWRESAHRQAMTALALSGQRAAALAQYERCVTALAEELGVEPETETVTLYGRIRHSELAPPRTSVTARSGVTPTTRAPLEVEPPSPAPPMEPDVPDTERRILTVVQAEVSAAADLLAHLGTEGWVVVLSQLLRAVGAEVRRYGGEVERYDEHGLVALFGARGVHEDDAERGTLAALAMRDVVRTHLAELPENALSSKSDGLGPGPDLDPDGLNLRVAVHTGETVVIPVEGAGQTGRWAVIGDAMPYADRVLAQARPGEIRVSEATHRLITPLFAWAPHWGEDANTQSYVLLAHKVLSDKGRGIPGMRSAMVGRDRELQLLREPVERLSAGAGAIVTLVGEAGIGKSRLVEECQATVAATSPPIQWVEGRCVSYGGTTPYYLWASVLRSLLGVTPDTPQAVVGHALRQTLRTLDAERREATFAYLGSIIGAPLNTQARAMLAQIDVETLKDVTFDAVERLLEAVLEQRPLVIVCEDLHWADPTSLQLLERLLGLVERAPLILLCVFRPDRNHGCWHIREIAQNGYPHRHVDLDLRPLSPSDGEVLLRNLLLSLPRPDGRETVEALPPELKAQILSRGDGIPFYVEEILRTLTRAGVIICDTASCRWEVSEEAAEIHIPDTLYGVLRARIDQLSVGARHVLQLAAIIGSIFPYRLLAEVAERATLDQHLVTLQAEQLIRERVRVPEPEYVFTHQLMLEAAYSALSHRVLRVLHRRVAEALERLYPEKIEHHRGLLAYHWEQAGDTLRAIDYLRRSGEQAAALYANEEALGYLDRALDMMPTDDLAGRFAMHSIREIVQDRLGVREAQWEALSRLREVAVAFDKGGPSGKLWLAQVALREANFHNHVFDHPALAKAAQQAVALAQSIGDNAMQAQGHSEWGTALMRLGDSTQAMAHWREALDLARAGGHRYQEAQVLRELGVTSYEVGQHHETARTYLEENLRIHRETGNRMEEGKALNALAMINVRLHDLNAALADVEDGIRLCRLTGNRREEGWGLNTLGWTMCDLGDYPTSEVRYREAVQLLSRVRDPLGQSLSIAGLAWVAHYTGAYDAAREHSERALHLAGEMRAGVAIVSATLVLGHTLAAERRWSDASAAYQRALVLCSQASWHSWALSAHAGLARIALARGAPEEALPHAEEILRRVEISPELYGTYDPMRVYLTCYRALQASNDSRAEEVLQMAHHLLQAWASSIADDDLRRSFLENVAAHREILVAYAGAN